MISQLFSRTKSLRTALFTAALASATFVAACGDSTVEIPPGSDAGSSDAATTRGDGSASNETAFARNCSVCHGDEGQGSSAGPQIQSPVVGYATWVIRNGRASTMGFTGSMPAAVEAAVPAAELDEILGFLGQFPKPADGEGLYLRFCGNCHGADAKGGAVAQSLFKAAAQDSGVLGMVRKGHGGTRYADRKAYMPKWTADEISDAEVKLISAYIRTLPTN